LFVTHDTRFHTCSPSTAPIAIFAYQFGLLEFVPLELSRNEHTSVYFGYAVVKGESTQWESVAATLQSVFLLTLWVHKKPA
jgi:hypothetical protein